MRNNKQTPAAKPEACGTCRNSRMLLNQAGKPGLFCRAHPKQALLQITVIDGLVKNTTTLVGHVSVSFTEDWCGEYKFDAALKVPPQGTDATLPTQ